MSGAFDAGAYFPERPPTWLEVGLALLVVLTVGGRFLNGPVSVPAVVAGFLLFAVAVGPGAASGFGRRVGQWFRAIGNRGRALVIVLFGVGVAALSRVAAGLVTVLADAVSGGMVAVALYVVVHTVRAGEVSGWTSSRADRP